MSTETRYRLCPLCDRSSNTQSDEQFCVDDGAKMLESCPSCHAPIRTKGARFCGACGTGYKTSALRAVNETSNARDSSDALLTPAPNASWTATRRGRAAAILAILTIVGVVVVTWLDRQPLLNESFVGQIAGSALFTGLTVRSDRPCAARQAAADVCDGARSEFGFARAVANA